MVRIKHRYLLVQILYPNSTINTADYPTDTQQTLIHEHTPTLAFHSPTSDSITIPKLLKALRTELLQLFGDHGAGVAGGSLAVKYWSNATSTMILRCDRAVFRLVWAACTAIRELHVQHGAEADAAKRSRSAASGTEVVPCVFQVLRVSGTIRKCEEEAIRRATSLCGRVKGLSAVLDAGIGGGKLVEEEGEGKDGAIALAELSDNDSNDSVGVALD